MYCSSIWAELLQLLCGAQVDSFELVEESPCPAASRHQQARSPTLLHPQRSEELQVPSETAVAAIDKSLQDRATLQDAPAAHIPLQDHETIVHETQARAQVQAPPAQQQEAASLNAAASQPGPLPGTSSLHSTEWEPREQVRGVSPEPSQPTNCTPDTADLGPGADATEASDAVKVGSAQATSPAHRQLKVLQQSRHMQAHAIQQDYSRDCPDHLRSDANMPWQDQFAST